MMPFFALVMIESRLLRMFDELKAELGEDTLDEIEPDDLIELIQDKGQGYNAYIFEKHQTLKDICQNDKSFDVDFDAYLKGYDGETKDLLGVDAFDQYRIKTDKRSSITNDPNRLDDEQYIVRLIKKVITVSLETVKIVNGLPDLGLPKDEGKYNPL